jgi:hypothetical protein
MALLLIASFIRDFQIKKYPIAFRVKEQGASESYGYAEGGTVVLSPEI